MASNSVNNARLQVPSAVTTTTTTTAASSVEEIFQGQPKEELWRSLSVPMLDWNDVGIECFLGRGAFTHVHKGKITHKRQGRTKTMSSIESTVATSQSSFSLVSVASESSSIESIAIDETTSELASSGLDASTMPQSPSLPSKHQALCAIKCINPTKTKRKEALISASNDLLNEAMLLSELSPHEHIVHFLGILPQEVDDEEEEEETKSRPGMYKKDKIIKDYVLVLECLDETLSARLKRWRREQLQMQKQFQEIWMAQELVLEQNNRLLLQNQNQVGRGRRLGTGVRNLWRRLNHNGAPLPPQPPAPVQPTTAGRRGRWGRLLNRETPSPQEPPTTNHDTSARVEDYRELVNTETNEFRLRQMNERMESIVLGIVAGMKHMHDHQIVHRDLKPQNIGFDLKTQTVKLFDFGLARQLPYNVQTATALYYSQRRKSSLGSHGKRRRSNSIGSGSGPIGRRRSNSIGSSNTNNSGGHPRRRISNGSCNSENNTAVPPNPTIGEVVGTWRYMAPETMRSLGSDYASDVFSFAIMLSEICTLQRPYFNDEDDEDDELIHPAATTPKRSDQPTKNRYGPYENWNHLKSCIMEEGHRPNLTSLPKHSSTSDMQMWMNQCWDPEPYRRPTFDSLYQLIQHYCNEHHVTLVDI